MVSKESTQEHVQTTLMATMLIEALSADPMPPALKSGVKKKPTSPMFNQPNRPEEEDKGGAKEEEDENNRRRMTKYRRKRK